MACEDILPDFIKTHYEVKEWRHACAIMQNDFPDEWHYIVIVLTAFRLKKGYISKSGGNLSPVSAALNLAFLDRGWREKRWDTTVTLQPKSRVKQAKKTVELPDLAVERGSPTHNVDCFKNKMSLEIELRIKTIENPTDVVIEVRGGSVVDVYSESSKVRLVLIDWDDMRREFLKDTVSVEAILSLCYAESTDGLHWTKPALGLITR